jgi:hypothetical protein
VLKWIRTRSRRDLILALLVAGGALLVGTFAITQSREFRGYATATYDHQSAGGTLFDQSFDMGRSGSVEVRMGDVDIVIASTDGSEAHVELFGEDGVPASSRVLEAIGFRVERSGSTLRVWTEDDGGWDRDFDADDFDLALRVTVPEGFNVQAQTGDGDIAVERFEGDVSVQTGDGDIAVAGAGGTSLRAQTGDGDVAVAGSSSEHISVRTGDGDVALTSLSSADVQVRTGDGDILVRDLAGPLEASTGVGDVDVYIERFAGIEIRTGDGDVTLHAPRGLAADVELRGTEFFLGDAFALPAIFDERRLEGPLNGGGERLSVRVGDGTIRLIER